MVAFTRALVRIPTVNPPGQRYAECAQLVAGTLRDLGYRVVTLDADGLPEHTPAYPRPNVLGRLGASEAPALHFNGHFDVVPPEGGWTVDPFAAEVRDGRIYGRGTCDQKAGIAASIFAVEAVRRAGIPLRSAVEQSATVDEESGGFAGVAWLCDRAHISRARQRYVVITEPLDPERVCIGHRGVYWFEVTTLGRVGHGSMPGLAVNAAEQMARAIQAFEMTLKPALAARKSAAAVEPPQARQPSINLNSIHAGQPLGGWQTPTVPDRCTAVFDRRFIHEEHFENVRAEIVEILDRQGIAYELRDLMRVDPLVGDPRGALAAATGQAIRDALCVEPGFIVSPGTYDQKHVVRRAGIQECIAYGPGRLVLAHQPDEYVAVADLLAAAKVMALLTVRLAGAVDRP
ncbi:MAG: acetylornithine deacetylase/succinyl-diaminopimelate desuccinylase family protein [Chloroflexi bacterium]|nr:acetylornithine deacetylase/succinyl-diaminopimelate desuccinylase family protein [Chloroflexota bacterium]